jgi:hypothetical protein
VWKESAQRAPPSSEQDDRARAWECETDRWALDVCTSFPWWTVMATRCIWAGWVVFGPKSFFSLSFYFFSFLFCFSFLSLNPQFRIQMFVANLYLNLNV